MVLFVASTTRPLGGGGVLEDLRHQQSVLRRSVPGEHRARVDGYLVLGKAILQRSSSIGCCVFARIYSLLQFSESTIQPQFVVDLAVGVDHIVRVLCIASTASCRLGWAQSAGHGIDIMQVLLRHIAGCDRVSLRADGAR